MAQNRPNKPSVTLPDNFGGVKNEFSSKRISNGYEASTPEIVEGGNLNYMLDGLFQNTKYMRTVLDYVRDTPVGRMFWVNSSGQMDYIQPAIIATNSEFNTGTATDKTPNVKQVVDKFATKSDDNSVVHKTGNETITGVKTFTDGMITNDIRPKGSITLGTSTNTWGKQLQFQDTTEKRIARIQPLAIDTTNNRVGMWVNNADNTVEKGIYVDSDGTTSAPTPPAGDNSTKIATTAFVKTAVSNVLASLYPVGSIYITTQNTSSCPIATLIPGSVWELVATNRALWGGDGTDAHRWIAAGLPDHAHTSSKVRTGTVWLDKYRGSGGNYPSEQTLSFESTSLASTTNSIYGNSNTVQPPAYVVNVWRRTA